MITYFLQAKTPRNTSAQAAQTRDTSVPRVENLSRVENVPEASVRSGDRIPAEGGQTEAATPSQVVIADAAAEV